MRGNLAYNLDLENINMRHLFGFILVYLRYCNMFLKKYNIAAFNMDRTVKVMDLFMSLCLVFILSQPLAILRPKFNV